jgi:hypothetical protein
MREAVHEVGHGIIAVLKGYILNAVHLDGPPHNPGYVDRAIPGGLDGNDPVWARKELAVFCAGYMSERVIYGWNHEPYVRNAHQDSDWWVIRQCAVMHLQIQADIDAINLAEDPGGGPLSKILWRDVLPSLAWDQYDALTRAVEGEVRNQLEERTVAIRHLARILERDRVIDGPCFIQEMS